MSASTVDAEVIDAINQANMAVLGAETILTSGAGKAYQMVAQASALAVQDAVDGLRSAATLADAAAAAALSQMIATGETRYLDILHAVEEMRTSAVQVFNARASAAIDVLKNFPGG